MPLSFQDFVRVLQSAPQGATDEHIVSAAKAAEGGGPLQKIWETVNRPLVGSEDALIPGLRHTHGADEGTVRRVAEDLGASLSSPFNLALTGLGLGAAKAGEAGLLGISRAARVGEAALQAPLAAEGLKNVVEGDTPGKKLSGAIEAGLAGAGIKHAATHAFEPGAVKAAYMAEKGYSPAASKPALNPDLSKRIADAYEAMQHDPDNPAVKKAYGALANEVSAQYAFLKDRAGLKMEPWNKPGQPYANSAEMRADLGKNHLFYFPSESGFGSAEGTPDHPLLKPGASGLPLNDELRAIHDYFGHGVNANQFGPKGEEAAWRDHREMFSEAAAPALTTETRGQNSWVNFGPHLRNAAGDIPAKGEPGFRPPAERPFAPQKAGLLPAEFSETVPQPSADELADARLNPAIAQTPASATGQSPAAPPSIQLSPELLADVNARHNVFGGSSTSLTAQRGLTPQDAPFILSPYEDRQLILDNPPTEQDLRNYVMKNEDLLTQPGHNLGTWRNPDNGKHYLDVAIGEKDQQKALALAKQHKQLAIFDMVNGKDIPVTEPAVNTGANAPDFNEVFKERAKQHLVDGPAAALDKLAALGVEGAENESNRLKLANPQRFKGEAASANAERNAPYGEGSILPSAVKPTELRGTTALAVASPAASAAIDDSDPNDPNQTIKHYGKLALDVIGGLAAGAALRKGEVPLQKQAASHGAALMLLGEKPKMWERRILDMGVTREDLPKVRAAAQKILEKQAQKSAGGLPNTQKLIEAFHAGKGDADWYDTHKELQHYFGKDADLVAQLIAATSSNSTVKSNLTLALKAYTQLKANGMQPLEKGFLPAVVKQVNSVAAGTGLQGRKVHNFAKALLGDPDAVVVDRWMMRAFGYNKDIPTPEQYDLIEHAVKELAAKKGVEPRQMQAAIWFGVKNAAEAGKARPSSPSYGKILQDRFGELLPEALKR